MKIGPEWENKCATRQRNERYKSDTDTSVNIKHAHLIGSTHWRGFILKAGQKEGCAFYIYPNVQSVLVL